MQGKNVLLMIVPYSQPRMEGIARFAKEREWNLMVADRLDATEDPVQFDGVIMSLRNRAAMAQYAKRILEAGVPAVDLTIECPEIAMPRAIADHAKLGAIAARHFAERGFMHMAFFSSSWSNVHRLRFEGFKAALPAGATLERWTLKDAAEHIASSPKPAGALAYNDIDAARLVAACRRCGASIPRDVAVMGIGNDRFLCETQQTAISSIDQNLSLGAYEGARLLQTLMEGRKPASSLVVVPPGQVYPRASSDTLAHSDPQVRSALLCIHANISRPFGAQEVAARLGIPRRTLDRLFAKELHRSVGCEILRQRLMRAKRLLSDPAVPIKNVASACGFCNAAYLTNIFRDETGMTPRVWRNSQSGA